MQRQSSHALTCQMQMPLVPAPGLPAAAPTPCWTCQQASPVAPLGRQTGCCHCPSLSFHPTCRASTAARIARRIARLCVAHQINDPPMHAGAYPLQYPFSGAALMALHYANMPCLHSVARCPALVKPQSPVNCFLSQPVITGIHGT